MFIPSFLSPARSCVDREICLCGNVVSLNHKVKTTLSFCNRLGKVHIASFFSFRTHNTLYAPEMLAKMVEPFTKALDMLEAEKSAILGKKSSLFSLEVRLISNGLLKQPQCALCLPPPHLALP